MPIDSEGYVYGPGVERPDFIEIDQLGLERVGDVTIGDHDTKVTYDVYEITPDHEIPDIIAEWMRYRTLSENSVHAGHEKDTIRFKNVEEIKQSFLTDMGGRTLFIAVHPEKGTLDGVAWAHGLEGDEFDFLLLDAGRLGLKDPEAGADELATLASREYGWATHKGLSLGVGVTAISRYFDTQPDFKGIVGRYGDSDSVAHQLQEAQKRLSEEHTIRVVDNSRGWIILMALREPDTEYSRY